MAQRLSLPQAGLLCLVALGVGAVIGHGLAGAMASRPSAGGAGQYSVSVQDTAARITATGLSAGVLVVAYGRNVSYGRLATARIGPDGRAIIGLTGLDPGTRYRYRAQVITGSGAARSGTTGSFTTAPAVGGEPAGGPDAGVNASSNAGNAGQAFDGQQGTAWQPEDKTQEGEQEGSSGDEQTVEEYLTFEYAQKQDIVGFGVWTRSRESNGTMRFLLYVDGEKFGPYQVDDDEDMQYFSVETVGTEFRIGILERSAGTGIREFELRTAEDLE